MLALTLIRPYWFYALFSFSATSILVGLHLLLLTIINISASSYNSYFLLLFFSMQYVYFCVYMLTLLTMNYEHFFIKHLQKYIFPSPACKLFLFYQIFRLPVFHCYNFATSFIINCLDF